MHIRIRSRGAYQIIQNRSHILLFNCYIVLCMEFLVVLQVWHLKDLQTLVSAG